MTKRGDGSPGPSHGRVLAENMAIVGIGKAIVVIVGLGAMAIMARHLGPEGFGHYRTALTYVSLTAVLADLGLYMVVIKEITKPGADRREILSAALGLRLVSSCVVLALAALLALLLPYDRVVHQGIFLCIALYVAYHATEFLAAVFQAHLLQTPQVIGECLGGVVMLAATALAMWLDLHALAMILATVTGAIVTFAWCWWSALRLESFGLAFSLARWRRLIIMGLPLAGSQILVLALVRGDTFILSLFHEAASVGIYGLPTKIFEILTTVSFVFAGLMMGFFVKAVAAGDEQAFGDHLREAIESMAVLGAGYTAFFLVHAEDVLSLIGGAAYVEGATALRLVAVAAATQSMVHILRFALTAREKQHLVLRVDVITFVTGFSLYLVLIPPLSYLGAALATMVNEIIVLALNARTIASLGHRPFRPGRMLAIAACGALLAGLLSVLRAIGLPWLAGAVVGGVFYLLALVLLRCTTVSTGEGTHASGSDFGGIIFFLEETICNRSTPQLRGNAGRREVNTCSVPGQSCRLARVSNFRSGNPSAR